MWAATGRAATRPRFEATACDSCITGVEGRGNYAARNAPSPVPLVESRSGNIS